MARKKHVWAIMHKGVIVAHPDTPLDEVVRVMADTGVHGLAVAEEEDAPLLGTISHMDVIKYWNEDLSRYKARDVMTPEVISVSPDDLIEDAIRIMLEHHIHRVFVVQDGRAVGVLSTTDIIREMRGSRWTWYMSVDI
ncbi:MAG: CBS domain-containing protein [Chloroflexi bacterium]|nr:CBS domain-containing protein [Chloroflexota bacterium]